MNIEETRKKYDKWIKVGLIAAACLAIAPIVYTIIQGMIGAIIAVGLGLVVINMAPVVSMRIANWKVKLIAAEARENPIETMQNLIQAKKAAFMEAKERVTEAAKAALSFEQKCQEFAKLYPARAPEFEKQLLGMKALVRRKKEALNEAEEMIKVGEDKLREMTAYWQMAEAANAANKAAGMDTGDLFAKMKEDTAVDAVWANMNKAFATLEVEAALDEPLVIGNDRTAPTIVLNTVGKSQTAYEAR